MRDRDPEPREVVRRPRQVTHEVDAELYFCSPHRPWEKGTVENANGLLREYFPKGTDFSAVTDEDVTEVYDAINRRPRKCLGWRIPWEVHYGQAFPCMLFAAKESVHYLSYLNNMPASDHAVII